MNKNRLMTELECWRQIYPGAIALLRVGTWQHRAAVLVSLTRLTHVEQVRIGTDMTSWSVWVRHF